MTLTRECPVGGPPLCQNDLVGRYVKEIERLESVVASQMSSIVELQRRDNEQSAHHKGLVSEGLMWKSEADRLRVALVEIVVNVACHCDGKHQYKCAGCVARKALGQ